jgi:hypothetical protein
VSVSERVCECVCESVSVCESVCVCECERERERERERMHTLVHHSQCMWKTTCNFFALFFRLFLDTKWPC